MKHKDNMAFSIVEMMVSFGILAGVIMTSSKMFKSQQYAHLDIERKTEANTVYGLLGKIFTDQSTCNSVFIGESNTSNVAGKLALIIPEELNKFITLDAARISNVQMNRTAPFQLDIDLTFKDLNQKEQKNSYRFFVEARANQNGSILYCHTRFASFLSTLCDLIGGELAARDVNNDGIAQELACRLRYCDANPLSVLYNPPNTPSTNLNLDLAIYQRHHATSRYCFVRYVDLFLNQVSSNGNYLLQTNSDTMTGSLQGSSSTAPVPAFTTQGQLQARQWCLGGSCRTVLNSPCPAGQYVQEIDVAGNVSCGANPLVGCTRVCPQASELCEGFRYDGHDGCGARCNVLGTRPPACRDNDPDPTLCVGQSRNVQNGCSDRTCLLRGTRLPTCSTGDLDPSLCSSLTRTQSDGCGNTCTIYGSMDCVTPSPTPSGYCPERDPSCQLWSLGNTPECCASQTWAGPAPCPPSCGTPPTLTPTPTSTASSGGCILDRRYCGGALNTWCESASDPACVHTGSSVVLEAGRIGIIAGRANDGSVMARTYKCESGVLVNLGGNCVGIDAQHPHLSANGCTANSWSANMTCLRNAEGASILVDVTSPSDRTYYGP